jgi:hypothetical protein
MTITLLILQGGEAGEQMITIPQVIQLGGVLVSFLVVARQLFTLARDWRGGPPELRLISRQIEESNTHLRESNDQLRESNDRILQLVQVIIDRLDESR